mmetsp:Transcript_40488/g.35931  ORF Transcript_40488/g.35931 Transcript_40488/m.35931 type:complete len:117 (+) Transcript_40488:51-401(+)
MQADDTFEFKDPGELKDDDLELVLVKKNPADKGKGFVPMYDFEMRHSKTKEVMGNINLRIGDSESLYYGGHVGYGVDEKYRGHNYSARAVKMLLPLAKAHNRKSIDITCEVSNIAS